MRARGLRLLLSLGLASSVGVGVARAATTAPVPPGTILFVSSTNDTPRWQLFSIRTDGTGLVQAVHANRRFTEPTWAPNGSRIAVVQDGRSRQILVMDPDGSNSVQVTNHGYPYNWRAPDWSKDGTTIVFIRQTPCEEHVWTMAPDGSNKTEITHHGCGQARDHGPTWSPDGTRIAFSEYVGGADDLFVMNADGTGITQLTFTPTTNEEDPAWSPDGSVIAYTRIKPRSDGRVDICAITPDGTGHHVLTRGVRSHGSASWSPDGTALAYVAYDTASDQFSLHVMRADGTGSHILYSADYLAEPAWKPVP